MPGREDLVGIDEYLPHSMGVRLPGNLATALESFHILINHPEITNRRDAAERNWAEGKANGTLLGSPTYLPDSIEFTSGVSGLRTSMLDIYPSSTLAIVSADVSPAPGADAATRGFHIGSSAGTNDSNGANIYTSYNSSVANIRSNARYGASGTNNTYSTASDNNIGFALRIAQFGSATEDIYYKNMTTNAEATADVPTGNARILNSQPVQIGTDQSLAWGGKVRASVALTWSRKTTPTDHADLYAYLKRLLATVARPI